MARPRFRRCPSRSPPPRRTHLLPPAEPAEAARPIAMSGPPPSALPPPVEAAETPRPPHVHARRRCPGRSAPTRGPVTGGLGCQGAAGRLDRGLAGAGRRARRRGHRGSPPARGDAARSGRSGRPASHWSARHRRSAGAGRVAGPIWRWRSIAMRRGWPRPRGKRPGWLSAASRPPGRARRGSSGATTTGCPPARSSPGPLRCGLPRRHGFGASVISRRPRPARARRTVSLRPSGAFKRRPGCGRTGSWVP